MARYDVILGTVFMRKHGIILDFERDEIRHKDQILPSMREGPDTYLLVRRQAMQFRDQELGRRNIGRSEESKGTSE